MRIASKSGERFVFSWCVLNILPSSIKAARRLNSKPSSRYEPRLKTESGHLLNFFASTHQLHVEAKRLKFTDQDVERLRHPGIEVSLAFDYRLVNLRPAGHVIRLCGQQFLQDVSRAICFKGPHLHFAESLAAELRLSAEGLL